MINEETVKHVAKTARINLTDEEILKFSKQLNDIFEDFKLLDELDVENVEPSFHPIKTENVLRDDEIGECLKRDEAFKIACHTEKGYYKAPKIM